MPRACTICTHPAIEAIDEALRGGDSAPKVAKAFNVSRDSVGRHRRHALDGPAAAATGQPGTHERAALALIDQAKAHAGVQYSAQDKAEAENLLAVSKLADANPASLAAQRELRLTISDFRRIWEDRPDTHEQAEVDALIKALTGPAPPAQRIDR